jgi:GT2 family glycosyltransferase
LRGALSEFLAGAPGKPLPLAIVVDHDHRSSDSRRTDPDFKPGFSPELLLEQDYVGRAAAFRRGGVLELGGFRDAGGSLVRATLWKGFVEGHAIGKCDRILLHQTAPGGPQGLGPGPANPDPADFAQWAVRERGLEERATIRRLSHGLQVRFDVPAGSRVSIVITFRDKVELLRQAIGSILRLTSYPDYELVLVDNRSCDPATRAYLDELHPDPRIRVLEFDETFNYSRANNLGAAAANGDFIVFLNNDTRLLTPDWLQQMCGYAALPDIGAVGAKLLYADGSIQHAGVVIGMTGYAGHLFSGEHETFLPASWLRSTRNFSAVTGACMAIERRKLEQAGGFDERLTLTGNDVELCLRLAKAGCRHVVVPSVVLFHYEKSTRRDIPVTEYNKRLSLYTYREILSSGDPYFNRNLSLRSTRLEPKGRADLPAAESATAPAPDRTPAESSLSRASRFLNLYDLSQAELAANRAVIDGFVQCRHVEPRVITWFIPHFDHVYRGGIYTVMRIADHFTRRSGTLNRFVCYGRGGGDLEGMNRHIEEAFPAMKRDLVLLRPQDSEADLPPADLGFCTLWTSAYHLARYNQCRGKLYLVQDFEGGFSPENSVFGLAEQTYRLGFVGVANTPGVCETYRRYGSQAEYFVPAVDRSVFSPATEKVPRPPIRVVFYGRPDKPRNAFALGVESLRELKRRHGDSVEILSVGAEFKVADYGLEGVLVNLGLLPDIHAVANLYRHSHVGLVFMLSKHPSYQPFEYMASGCAVVSNVNEANSWFLRDRENCLSVPPLRTAVVEAIEELMRDDKLHASLVRGGLETVSRTTWVEELDVIHRFVTRGEGRRASREGEIGARAFSA